MNAGLWPKTNCLRTPRAAAAAKSAASHCVGAFESAPTGSVLMTAKWMPLKSKLYESLL